MPPAASTETTLNIQGGTKMQFVFSSLIFFCLQLPLIVASFIIVPFMLLTKWEGKTTWFGNFKYGRGDTHYKFPATGIFWRQWWFLCVRNPVSNFGKKVLSVKDADWVWLYDKQIFKSFHWKYGWKNPNSENDNLRSFVYRPWLRNPDK